LFFFLGAHIGPLTCVLLTIASCALGVVLFRFQGFRMLAVAQKTISNGSLPLGPVISGLGILLAGILLTLPGFFTDSIGLIFLIPKARLFFVKLLLSGQTKQAMSFFGFQRASYSDVDSGPIIDGVYRDTDKKPEQSRDIDKVQPRD